MICNFHLNIFMLIWSSLQFVYKLDDFLQSQLITLSNESIPESIMLRVFLSNHLVYLLSYHDHALVGEIHSKAIWRRKKDNGATWRRHSNLHLVCLIFKYWMFCFRVFIECVRIDHCNWDFVIDLMTNIDLFFDDFRFPSYINWWTRCELTT